MKHIKTHSNKVLVYSIKKYINRTKKISVNAPIRNGVILSHACKQILSTS